MYPSRIDSGVITWNEGKRVEVPIGAKIGGGCFANVYNLLGDRKTVLKATTCLISVHFLELAGKSKNPHFPKGIRLLGAIGEDCEGDAIYAVAVERLKNPKWRGKLRDFRNRSDSFIAGQMNGTRINGVLTEFIEDIKGPRGMELNIPHSLYEAFIELRDICDTLVEEWGSNVCLDLHAWNYMMRGDTIVINDPVADYGRC